MLIAAVLAWDVAATLLCDAPLNSHVGSYVCGVCGKKYKYYNCFQTHVRAHRGKSLVFPLISPEKLNNNRLRLPPSWLCHPEIIRLLHVSRGVPRYGHKLRLINCVSPAYELTRREEGAVSTPWSPGRFVWGCLSSLPTSCRVREHGGRRSTPDTQQWVQPVPTHTHKLIGTNCLFHTQLI